MALIDNLINNFNIETLQNFLSEKLHSFKKSRENLSYSFFNDAQYEKYSDFEFIGEATFNNNELQEDIIAISCKTTDPLTERTGKKVQYELAKAVLKNRFADLAFFIFYDDEGDFRFSIVKGERKDSTGRLEFTSFKRYTYFVSKTQTNKTFRNQINNSSFSSIAEIIEAFSVEKLNEDFYNELSNWYFWAISKVTFPDDTEKDSEVRNATNVIRLITRLIFVWFLKQKNLVPNELFDKKEIDKILNYSDKTESTYYKAILQNLFFATLNTEMTGNKRKFVNRQSGVQGFYRYERFFADRKRFLYLTEKIPFLNGGLFENLDREIEYEDGSRQIARIDCFSNRRDLEEKLVVPDFLFFGEYSDINLNEAYGDRKHSSLTVRGIIDILKSYNFTIEENNPVEVEVALDPELLGKVFENLLASYNPETKTTARKQSGSFYTPREIVDYMCDESLLIYLNETVKGKETIAEKKLKDLLTYNDNEIEFTDEQTEYLIKAIDNCKILDPACGSGAFPMGILQKMVFVLQKLDPENKKWKTIQEKRAKQESQELINKLEKDKELINQISSLPDLKSQALTELDQRLKQIEDAFSLNTNELDYARKLFLIENCIFGVDIQPIAIQISKLRFFISLLVEQTVDDKLPNRGIIPMPNMETKFVAANTLVALSKENLIKPVALYPLEAELKDVRNKHFSARTPETKKKYRREDKRLREEIGRILRENGFSPTSAKQIADWNPYDQNSSAKWFDTEWMFGQTEGFDIVIGNPPYLKEGRVSKTVFEGLKQSPYYQGKMDLWYMFACVGIDLLSRNGTLCFIATNNWVTNNGASKLRNKVVSDSKIIQLIDFGNFMIFESASIQTMIMIFSKNNYTNNYTFDCRKLNGNTVLSDVLDLLNKRANDKASYLSPKITREKFKNSYLTFNSNISLLEKISSTSFNLSENEIAQGIVFPQDFLNKKNQRILGTNYVVGESIFGLTNQKKNEFYLSEIEQNLIKPYYTTEQIHRYYANPENTLWLIYTDSRFKDPNSMDDFPNLKRHLDRFSNIITSDNKPYGLHRAREERFFKGEKILALRKSVGTPSFSYSNFDCYVSATFYVIKTDRVNMKYLTGLLNSKLIAFWLKNKGKMQGDNYQLDKEPLLQIPIRIGNESQLTSTIRLVEQIIYLKQNNPNEDTYNIEKGIDIIVYKLYELTYNEVRIIDLEFDLSEEEYNNYQIEE